MVPRLAACAVLLATLSGCASPPASPASDAVPSAAVVPESTSPGAPIIDIAFVFDGTDLNPRRFPFNVTEASRVEYEVDTEGHVAAARITRATNPDYAYDSDPHWAPTLGGPLLRANASVDPGLYRLIVECNDVFPCEGHARVWVHAGAAFNATPMGGRTAIFQPPECRKATAFDAQFLPAWQPATGESGNHMYVETTREGVRNVTQYGPGEFAVIGAYDDGRASLVLLPSDGTLGWIDVGRHCIAPYVGLFGNVSTEFRGVASRVPALIMPDPGHPQDLRRVGGECGSLKAAFVIDDVGYRDDLWGRLDHITFRFERHCDTTIVLGKVVWQCPGLIGEGALCA